MVLIPEYPTKLLTNLLLGIGDELLQPGNIKTTPEGSWNPVYREFLS